MAGLDASCTMVLEAAQILAVSTLAVSTLSNGDPKQEVRETSDDGGNKQLAVLPISTPRLRTRTKVKYDMDLDSSSSQSKGSGKTAWNQSDTLDLIDAVKIVEHNQRLANPSGKISKTGYKTFKGNKWKQVAELLPHCWMSSSDRFPVICRGKCQELRRTYQGMLRGETVYKSFTEEVCQKWKDYIDEDPPLHLFEENEDCKSQKLINNCSSSRIPKSKCIADIKSPKRLQVGSVRTRSSTHSESGRKKEQVRRSLRIPKRSCRLELSFGEVEREDSPPEFTPPDRRSTRMHIDPTAGKLQRTLRKRARLEAPEDHDEDHDEADEQVETISELFKKNFELLRSNIDFSTEYHLHKHLHKHFQVFEDRMTRLIQQIDQKIDRLDQKVEEKLGSVYQASNLEVLL